MQKSDQKQSARRKWREHCDKYYSGFDPCYVSTFEFHEDSFGTFGIRIPMRTIGDHALRCCGLDPDKYHVVIEYGSLGLNVIAYDKEYQNVRIPLPEGKENKSVMGLRYTVHEYQKR